MNTLRTWRNQLVCWLFKKAHARGWVDHDFVYQIMVPLDMDRVHREAGELAEKIKTRYPLSSQPTLALRAEKGREPELIEYY